LWHFRDRASRQGIAASESAHRETAVGALPVLSAEDQIKEHAYVEVRGYRVAERSIRVQLVMIAAALALAREVASFFEIGDDTLHGSLGDPDSGCDFTQPNLRLLCDANQNVGVIAQKRPVKIRRVPT
jgi:hypothetical protein